MKKLLLVWLLAVSTAFAASAQQDISLDGEWQMTINGKEYNVIVPHTYNIMEGLEDYAGEAVYRRTGRQQTIALPDMQPGERYPLVLRNVNSQYAFEVVRPGGFSVIKY